MSKVPDGWQKQVIGDLVDVLTGFPFSSEEYTDSENDIKLLRGDNIIPGGFRWENVKKWDRDNTSDLTKYFLEVDDVILAMDRPWIGAGLKYAFIRKDDLPCLLVQRVARLRSKHTLDQRYLAQLVASREFSTYLQLLQHGSAVPHISADQIRNFPFLLPPPPEQRAIAAILSTWDEAITLTEALIEALQQRKQALMQLLLTGEVRFQEFDGDEWDEIKIGSFLKESRIPGSNGAKAHKLTVKLYGRGVKAKDEPKLGSENTVYYKRKAGQFIYSKLDFLNGAFGIIPSELDGFETTLDLPTFDISPIVNSILFLKYVSRESFYQSFLESALGGRKAKRVQPSELLSKKIKLPSIEEQNQIAEVINLLEEEESTLTRYFETIQVQKRALMQQLLTGTIRVERTIYE